MTEHTEDKNNAELGKPSGLVNYLKIGSNPGKIPELDGLRAFAILMVLLFHFATYYQKVHRSYYSKNFPESLQNLMQNGWLGVDLFFVLSGFLIFRHLMSVGRQQNKKQIYGRYALKRILRTFPLYYAIILLVTLGLIPYYRLDVSVSDFLIHLVFLQDYLSNDILIPLWSLATEEKFYLLAPLLYFVLKKLSPRAGLVLLMLVVIVLMIWRSFAVAGIDSALNYGSFFSQFRAPFHYAVVSIAVGVAVAMVSQWRQPRFLPIVALLCVLVVIAVMLFCDLYSVKSWQWVHWLHVLMVLLFGVLVWVAVNFSGARYLRFLCGRSLRVISVLSYALYLTHYAVLPWVHQLHKKHVYSEVPWVHGMTFFVVYIFITLALSLILHYLVEKPFLLIKDRL